VAPQGQGKPTFEFDYFLIPKRIRATKGQGLIVILGNTRGTLERNILDPMRQIYGNKLVGNISSDNTVILFGKKVYALGADKRNQVARIQGAGIEYCYGDEITTWSEEVFQVLKSRLDKPNSCFDGTCNPDHPNHWFKEFLDSDADIYHQHYTIDDNPFLDPFFVEQIKKEYAGTVYYDRFILGKWTRAEGVIYRLFADEPERYEISVKEAQEKLYQEITVGVDFGGNKSKHAFVATGILPKYKGIVVLASERHDTNVTPTELDKLFTDFLKRIIDTYGSVDYVYPDSAEQVLIRGFRAAAQKERLNVIIRDAKKIEIRDRIRLVSALISQGRFFYTKDAYTVKDALCEAVWDESKNEDVRLDDGTSDIDTLDALEYSIERDARRFIRMR